MNEKLDNDHAKTKLKFLENYKSLMVQGYDLLWG
jgi:hypothetical protein